MWSEYKHTLRKLRGQILGWSLGLILYSLLMVFIYPDIAEIDISSLLESYPEEMLAFFGDSIRALTSAQGYLDIYFFNYMIVVLGIFAVGTGARLLVKEEEEGLMDLILAYPVSRSGLFWGRIFGYITALAAVLVLAWLTWWLPSRMVGLGLTAVELLRPFLSLFGVLLVFGSFALLLSVLLPFSRAASMLSGGALIASYLLTGLANINQDLQPLAKLTPLHFYQGGQAISGLNLDWLLITGELVILFLFLAWWRFLERDIAVGGEGGWKELLPGRRESSRNSSLWNQIRQPLIFFGQRLIFGLLVLGFISYASFLGLDMARGEPFQEAAVQSARKTLDYAGDVIQGEFGQTSSGSVSLRSKPVEEVVPAVLGRSLGLLGVSLAFAAVVGVLLGIFIAGKRSGITLGAIIFSIAGVSVPSFFAALLLQLGVIQLTKITGRTLLPAGGFGWDNHLVLPALVLAARPLAQISRVTFVTVEDILSQDYIRTAYSKGLRGIYVTAVHLLRNAAVPVLTTIGLSLRFALSSLPIVEFYFGWQGAGYTLLQAISNRDDYLTVILVLCLGILFIVVNMLLDGAYLMIDPRLRSKTEKANLRDRETIWQKGKKFASAVQHFFTERKWQSWFRKKEPAGPSPFREIIDSREEEFVYNNQLEMTRHRARVWLKGTLGNPALIIGTVIVLALLGVMLLSPVISPHSPYSTQSMTIEEGEFSVPPFPPGESFPWGTDPLGRDLMSLIFAGAQQTLTLAVSVVAVRLLVGFLLGAAGGWNSGGWMDRFVLGLSEVISAFPALLLVMVLILGMGIRQGMQPFIIALSFIGWGEIMQFVRSKVMEIKTKLFIEGAQAAGANSSRIIRKHVLPNLVPEMVSILSLEMGAVLMLLGELGFIGIFIGGGAFAELEIWGPPYHYSDVPEWGALLSNIRLYARSYPWTALYPAGAFFVAILGFNFFGEGIRRLIDRVGVAATRLFVNKYTLAALAVLGGVFFWFRGSTGSLAVFQQQARTFDGGNARTYVEILSNPAWAGRSLGSAGLDQAAEYIAGQFESLGLQPAGESLTYFQTRPRSYQQLDAIPKLRFHDTTYQPVYYEDFSAYVSQYRNLGEATAPVTYLGIGELMEIGQMFRNYPALEELDFSGEIVMVSSDQEADMIHDIPKSGVLVVTEDNSLLSQTATYSSRTPYYQPFGLDETRGMDTPVLRISERLADHLLADTGTQLDQLRLDQEKLEQDEFLIIPTGKTVTMEVEGTIHDDEEVVNVIGHLPGLNAQLDEQLIVIMAQYDSPPVIQGQTPSDAANNNASGVAVLLELIRTLQESGYQPNKTFLFVAYAGEGMEGGEWAVPEVSKLLQTKYGFSTAFDVEAVIEIRGVGAGSGDGLITSTEGSLRLVELFESSANRLGVSLERAEDRLDLSVIFEEGSRYESADEAPYLEIFWDGWWEVGGTPWDNLEEISADNLELSGEVLSLAAMVLGYEVNY